MPADRLIMGVDPSSTVIGYAVGTWDIDHGTVPDLLDAGRILPDRPKAPAWERAANMAPHLVEAWRDLVPAPSLVVFEVPAPSAPRRRAGRDRGQAYYGLAVGYTLCAMDAAGAALLPVRADEWTGRHDKATRQAALAIERRAYDAARDPGGDVADAIELMTWAARVRHALNRCIEAVRREAAAR